MEKDFTRALSRLAYTDSRRMLKFVMQILDNIDELSFDSLNDGQKRMLQMFYVSVWMDVIDYDNLQSAYENFHSLANSKVMLNEMKALFKYLYENIDFVDKQIDFGFDCPVDLHCTYSRDQLLVAMDFMKPSTVREGVKWLPDKKLDILFVTY